MESLLVRVIEKLFIIYFLSYFLLDLALFLIFLFSFNSNKKKYESGIETGRTFNKASIIVPAYNEEVSIVQCINMLSKLDYPDFEIIVVNDGSKDNTVQTLLNSFNFIVSDSGYENQINTAEVKFIYNFRDGKVILIDKLNGGKADAINAGINISKGDFICTIDADSLLDESSLKKVILPMLADERVFVTGGQIAISNETVIENDIITNYRMPENIWVLWQITEYIKSFLISRMGLSKINSLLIMSGAFSVFRRKDLLKIGGFLTLKNDHKYIRDIFKTEKSTVCEDMEIVVRLWRYYYENNLHGRIVYLAKPLCWTETPDNSGNLFKQRARWHQGLAECLFLHSEMLFDPKYHTIGLLAFPYYFFFELFSPLVKSASIIFLIYASVKGLINTEWILMMIILITLTTGVIMSITTVIVEKWSQKQSIRNREALRYKSFYDWLKLLFASIAGDFSYSFFKFFAQLKGLADFAGKKREWNKFERKGIRKIVTSVSETS